MKKQSLFVLLLAFACHTPKLASKKPPEEPVHETENRPIPKDLTAVLPTPAGQFAPSRVEFASGKVSGEALSDVETCGKCHQDVIEMWRTSAHSWASFDNPIYRMSVERIRREVGKTESRHCGGCHDTALLVDGMMDQEIDPYDKRAHAGLLCRTCHGISSATVDGNGSFVLTNEEIPMPKGSDPESIKQHVARVAPPVLKSPELCASCHRAFLDKSTGNTHHFAGMDDYTPWSRSLYAGSFAGLMDKDIPQQDCRGCHMPMVDAPSDSAATNGKVASHRFLGAHTWLASMRGDDETLKLVQEFLKNTVSLDITVAIDENGKRYLPAQTAPVIPGEKLLLDVVMRNQNVGHRFPGGTLDSQDTWLEVKAFDAKGKLIAQAGMEHETDKNDTDTHVLRSFTVGEGGVPMFTRETHKFRAAVYNSTLAPREVSVVQYGLTIPEKAALPIQVVATLRHRNKNLILQEATCNDMKDERIQAFAKATLEARGEMLDPCAPQPITDIAEAKLTLGGEATSQPVAEDWQKFYEHGLGMIRALQERVGEGRPSLEKALSLLSPEQHKERAMVMTAFASLAVRQGRLEEALEWLDKAEKEEPKHPAIAYVRGDAYSQVWRWKLAIAPFQEATKATPKDPQAWVKLAIAAGSADVSDIALYAAQQGLKLEPRNPDLLRVQALALKSFMSPLADPAMEAYLENRVLDTAPGMRGACSMKVDNCALERSPVHEHEMTP